MLVGILSVFWDETQLQLFVSIGLTSLLDGDVLHSNTVALLQFLHCEEACWQWIGPAVLEDQGQAGVGQAVVDPGAGHAQVDARGAHCASEPEVQAAGSTWIQDLVERVAELYRVLQDKQILWEVVYMAAMGLLREQVYWVVVVFMMTARVLPRGQLNLGVVLVATRVLLVEQILWVVVYMASWMVFLFKQNSQLMEFIDKRDNNVVVFYEKDNLVGLFYERNSLGLWAWDMDKLVKGVIRV